MQSEQPENQSDEDYKSLIKFLFEGFNTSNAELIDVSDNMLNIMICRVYNKITKSKKDILINWLSIKLINRTVLKWHLRTYKYFNPIW